MDLSKLRIYYKKRNRIIEPMQIFKALTLRGPVENIWDPQAEALKTWHENRSNCDNVIEMNTGGGKTFVGLLISLSLVNETQGKVLYVCATNQLVEQTVRQARDCGIAVASYERTNWCNEKIFDSCVGPCITNYAAVFNSRSIFREQDIRALVFDDAHVAYNVIRGQFTLKISRDHEAFRQIGNMFREYFASNNIGQQLDDALDGNWESLLFVPAFELYRRANEIATILRRSGVNDVTETKFAWGHTKDRLNICTLIISGRGIEIAPPILPIHTLPYFNSEIRRIYLTATLPSRVEFIRTFGIDNPCIISPGGKSGEAQRLFLFMPEDSDAEEREHVKQFLKDKKACIITCSSRSADNWCPPATMYDGKGGHLAIEKFARAGAPDKLALAARYDGIDLPGQSCRILVLDKLPLGTYLLDRFWERSLKIQDVRLRTTATRIVQAIGRIFRSNTDHGVVVICGVELKRWLFDPNHRRFMPKLLQQQIELGIELFGQQEMGKVDYEELMQAVLDGRKDWDEFYSANINEFDSTVECDDDKFYSKIAALEKRAYSQLWDGNVKEAAEKYGELSRDVWDKDSRLGAWYAHLEGLCRDINGEEEGALVCYLKAANERSELGRPKIESGKIISSEVLVVSEQAKEIAKRFSQNQGVFVRKLEGVRSGLSYNSSTNEVEQALRDLGELLGLKASRPDNELNTGPDVLWLCNGKHGLAMEAKTGKQRGSQYNKTDDIGKVHDHIQWEKDHYKDYVFINMIVGRYLRVSSSANPAPDLRVVLLEQFVDVAERLQKVIEFSRSDVNSKLVNTIQKALNLYGLNVPECFASLQYELAVDLKDEDILSDSVS